MRIQDFTLDRDPSRGNVYRDPSLVGLTVLAAFDWTTLFGRPGGPAAVVTPSVDVTMANYVDGAAPAKALSNLGYANRMVVADATDTLSLGNNFLLPTTCTDFVLYLWAKMTAVGADGFNNRVLSIRQGSSPTEVFAIIPIYSGSTLSAVEAWTPLSSGLNTILSDRMKAALIDDTLHLFAWHLESTGPNWRVRHFLNGELDQEKPLYGRPSIPAKQVSDYGSIGKGGVNYGVTGKIARAGLIDLTGYTARSADAIIRQQYADHAARLAIATA